MLLLEKVLRFVRDEGLIGEGDRILVAVSGGIDSVVLFDVLAEAARTFRCDLAIAHVNHLLRGAESLRDEDFVRKLADAAGVPFYLERVNVKELARTERRSVQHAGRDARYGFFRRTAGREGFGKIAVGHTLDDQVETFLLRLAKGTGVKGLASIRVKAGGIIRPLLETPRRDIEAHAARRGLAFVEDSSNRGHHYERNYLRHRVIPLFSAVNPRFSEAVLSLLKDLSLLNGALEAEVRAFMAGRVAGDGDCLSATVESLAGLPEEVRFRVIASMAARLEPGLILLRRHGSAVERILLGSRPNARVVLPGGLQARRVYDRLVLARRRPPVEMTEALPLHPGVNQFAALRKTVTVVPLDGPVESLDLGPGVAFFDHAKVGALSVRTFRPGDRFVPLGMGAPVKVKDFFISRKVPQDERPLVPIVLSGEDIIWLAGLRIDDRFKVTASTVSVLKVTMGPLIP